MTEPAKIQAAFRNAWHDYRRKYRPSGTQSKAANSIMCCKTGELGYNISRCDSCGYTEMHANSCRNRNCPLCQALLKEVWLDKRRSETIDTPYFHLVTTLPAELNPLIYANQELLYDLMHKCNAETILKLAADDRFLGAKPAIIQVLHTWGQELNYHPHIHSIISGGGLTPCLKLKSVSNNDFFVPVKVIGSKFKGKFLACLQEYYKQGKIVFPDSCKGLRNSYNWREFRDKLYKKDWCPYIKETYGANGNALEYLGRYANRVAITNGRIINVTSSDISFSAKDYKTGEKKVVTIPCIEFIRRFMQHVLPPGFQKIRYYGILNNCVKKKYLHIIFSIQGHRAFKSLYSGLDTDDLLLVIYKIDVHKCPQCHGRHMYLVKLKSKRLFC